MDLRLFKQVRVLLVMLSFLIVALVAVYFVFIYEPPSCFDGIRNQDEENIDCGGTCLTPCEIEPPEAPVVMWDGYFEAGEALYTFGAKIRNRNNSYGTARMDYIFTAKNEVGETIKKIEGSSFVAPGRTRYIVEANIPVPEKVFSADFEILADQIKWKRSTIHLDPVDFNIYTKNFNVLNDQQFFAEASGILRNETSYDFRRVEVDVFLYNSRSEVIAIGRTVLGDIVARKDREFKVFWPKRFEGTFSNMDVIAQTNFFDSRNFLRDF